MTDSEDCSNKDGDRGVNELNYYKAMSLINSLPQEVQTAIENDESRYNTNIDELRIIKEVLNTPIEKRTERQTEKLVEQMMEFDYFQKKCKDVKKNDLQEIISKMKWESESVFNDIYSQGDENDKFYVILRGVVQVLVPNPAIKGRALLYREYKNLLQWKKEEFDPLVELTKIER